MPIVAGPLTDGGAIIDLQVGVSRSRQQLLIKNGFVIPQPVPLRVLIDTGSSVTGFLKDVFQTLDIQPFWKTAILTSSTPSHQPHECNLFHVAISIFANGSVHEFSDHKVIETESFHPKEGIQGIVGRDLLSRCNFLYLGQERKFTFAF